LHRAILYRKGKHILKVLALVLALVALPRIAAAAAADLIVGIVHDTDGYPVSGATLTLRASGGASAGSGRTAADGTFAIEPARAVDRVEVRCEYCLAASATVRDGVPVVFVVRRFAALRDRGISAADARVLPYDRVTSLAALMPFTVTTGGTISDRGLAAGRGTVIADGIPLYRATDGVDLGTSIPAHAAATIAETGPDQANVYDARSSGGVFSIDTLDASAGLGRFDASSGFDATLRGGNVLRGAVSTVGGAYASSRATVDAGIPAAGGTLDVRAVDTSTSTANADGFAATFAAPIAGATLNAALDATRSRDLTGGENDGLAALSVQRGGLTAGVRAQRASGMLAGGAGAQADARAFIQDVFDDGHTHVVASLAAAQAGNALPGFAAANGALLPIFSASTHIGRWFDAHIDSVDALLPEPLYISAELPPGAAIARSHLSDAGIGFDDGNRVRIEAVAFRESLRGGGNETTGGSGLAAVWQVAPSLALRAWALISRTAEGYNSYEYPGPSSGSSIGTNAIDNNRYVVWITAGNTLRVDAISRNGRLEGDVSLPTGPHVRLVAGTRRNGPSRAYTFGLLLP
jgi:hypothetical protein